MRPSLRLAVLASVCLAVPGAVVAQERRPAGDVPFVQVTASAQGEFAYDRAVIPARFVAEGAAAPAVSASLARQAARALDALKALGLAEEDVRVIGPQVAVRYATQKEDRGRETLEKRVPSGFEGWLEIRVTAKALDLAPKIYAALIEAGGLPAGPQFSFSRDMEEQQRLAVEATTRAVAQARRLAEAAGGKPGRVLSVMDGEPYRPMPVAGMRAMAAPAPVSPDVPVRPGTVTLERSMTVQVEILP